MRSAGGRIAPSPRPSPARRRGGGIVVAFLNNCSLQIVGSRRRPQALTDSAGDSTIRAEVIPSCPLSTAVTSERIYSVTNANRAPHHPLPV